MERFGHLEVVLLKCFLSFLRLSSVVGTDIQGSVEKVPALLDTNVTLHCAVMSQGDVDFVLWKKIYNDDHDEVLIHNNHTTNVDKYRVDYPHGLVIIGLQVEDEALYQCEINDIGARTILKVLVPVSNLTISVDGDTSGGGPFNLTCHAQHARPPASLTWFRGTSDVTARAVSFTSFLHADGYGDSQSELHVPTDWDGWDVVFRCVASVGDPSGDDTAFLFLPHIGSASHLETIPILLAMPFLSFFLLPGYF